MKLLAFILPIVAALAVFALANRRREYRMDVSNSLPAAYVTTWAGLR